MNGLGRLCFSPLPVPVPVPAVGASEEGLDCEEVGLTAGVWSMLSDLGPLPLDPDGDAPAAAPVAGCGE